MPIFSRTSSMYTQIFKKGFPPLKYFFQWSSHNFEFRQKDKSCFFNHGEEKVKVEFFEFILRIYFWWRRSDISVSQYIPITDEVFLKISAVKTK